MRFGIVAPPTPDLMTPYEATEVLGFEAAWLFDSHLVCADVSVILALYAAYAADALRTGIAVAPSRLARVTAHTIATLDQRYSGRVVLGLGAGHTGRRTMGFAPMNARDFRDDVRTAKGLLRGETVAYREDDVMRPIRTIWGSPDSIRAARAVLNDGTQRAGRNLTAEGFRIILFHNVYVLHPSERADSVTRHGWPLARRSAPPCALGSMLAVWAARRHRRWRGA
jgi:Luciferase-like monooxygenase